MTAASRPGPFFGVTGGMLIALGVFLALANDDWIPLLISGLGGVLVVMALVAQRETTG